MSRTSHEITKLLGDWANGDMSAPDRLMPLVYRELHELAKRYMSRQNHWDTLQTTAVVHETYLKLAGDSAKNWKNRDHFFAVAAKAMRQVLIDHARAVHACKRGGSVAVSQLDDDTRAIVQPAAELIALDDALTAFAKLYPRKGDAVELRYFGGMSLEETAQVLKISQDRWFATSALRKRGFGANCSSDKRHSAHATSFTHKSCSIGVARTTPDHAGTQANSRIPAII